MPRNTFHAKHKNRKLEQKKKRQGKYNAKIHSYKQLVTMFSKTLCL